MDAKMLARLGAIAFVAVAITVAVVEMNDRDDESASASLSHAERTTSDPLRDELIRCAAMGEAGPRDADCLRAWAQNRERFLASGSRPAQRLPGGPSPAGQADVAPTQATPLQAPPPIRSGVTLSTPPATEAR